MSTIVICHKDMIKSTFFLSVIPVNNLLLGTSDNNTDHLSVALIHDPLHRILQL